jgi:hypothetical protein
VGAAADDPDILLSRWRNPCRHYPGANGRPDALEVRLDGSGATLLVHDALDPAPGVDLERRVAPIR